MAAMLSVMLCCGFMPVQASELLPPLPMPKPLIYRADTIIEQAKGIATYPVSRFDYVYQLPHPDHVPGRRLDRTVVSLVETDWGFATAQEGYEGVQSFTIDALEGAGLRHYSAGAIQAIIQALLELLNEEGLTGVYVAPHSAHISPYGEDVRPSFQTALAFTIKTARVGKIQTQGRGTRFKDENRINHPAHEWIAEASPLLPSDKNKQYGDLLNQDAISTFIARLNRHPGRHVTSSISGIHHGVKTGRALLNYNISESKPWIVYSQFANSGTGNTERWQKRAGFVHNQISGHDDIFSLDYATAGFDDYNAVSARYEMPWRWRRFSNLRVGFDSGFSEFTASDVGLPGADFSGKTLSMGLNLSYLFHQKKDWFLSLEGGAGWKSVSVDNELAGIEGKADFFKPRLGLSLERKNKLANTKAEAFIETNMAALSGTGSDDLAALGRTNVDSRWTSLSGSLRHSFFLEPLIYGDAFRDPTSPESSTMAHEIRLNARGQYVLGDDRLVPQEKFVLGGLYSVRGYPQSAVSGDGGFTASAEYRFHLPRILPFNPNPKTTLFGDVFRASPTQIFGYPDWDLVFKLFGDAGYVYHNDNVSGLEYNESLYSLGTGLELQLRRNLRLQIDYARAMKALESGRVEAGDSEIHIEATILY